MRRIIPSIVLLVAACGGGTADTTTPDTGRATLAPPSESTTTAPPSSTTAETRTGSVTTLATSGDGDDQTVTIEPLPDTVTWGDPPLSVAASSDSGLPVDVTTAGGCSLSGARVAFDQAGSCTVIATQAGDETWNPAQATATIEVRPLDATISFEPRTVTFVRELRVPLWATPKALRLRYRLVNHPDNVGEEFCSIEDGHLLFDTEPTPPPAPARCAVEATAVPSPNYRTPDPVVALVEIGFSNWAVRIDPVGTVNHAANGDSLRITVFEDSGSAYGITYEWSCTDGSSGSGAANPNPSKPGTTEYSFDMTIGSASGTCFVQADAQPQDHYGGQGFDEISFVVEP